FAGIRCRTARFRPQGQDAPSPDERSGHKPVMVAAGFPMVSHPFCAVLRDYPRNLVSTGRGIAGGRVPEAEVALGGRDYFSMHLRKAEDFFVGEHDNPVLAPCCEQVGPN